MRNQFLIALLAMASVPATLHAEEPLCDRSETKATPSPDGKWVANVQEEVCATPTGTAAGITVVIVSTKDAEHSQRVFIMPVPRSRDDWPRIRWDSPTAMEVRVPNLSEPSPPKPEYEGIHISLAYCGDNPADRASAAAYKAAVKQWQQDVTAWAQRRKQNADTAGTRPPRPEEPHLTPGQCSD